MEFLKELIMVVAIALVVNTPLNYLINDELGVKQTIHNKFYDNGGNKVLIGGLFFVLIIIVHVLVSGALERVKLINNYQVVVDGISIGILVLLINTLLPINQQQLTDEED